MLMQTVAALPCLALGAARLLELLPRRASVAVSLALAAWTVSRAAIIAAGADLDGKVVFWNEDAAVNRVVARLDAYASGSRVQSELWGNVLPRSRRLPPGGVWVHPWLHWYFPVEDVRARVLRAARAPGTIWVDYRTDLPGSERVGPFSIRVIGSKALH